MAARPGLGAATNWLAVLAAGRIATAASGTSQRVDWELYPPDADFIVLADTEGNRFCVIDTGGHPDTVTP